MEVETQGVERGGLDVPGIDAHPPDWTAIYERYAETDEPLDAAELDLYAEAAWWTGHLDETITARERAYRRYVEDGETRRAGLVALHLARDHRASLNGAVAHGWSSRAERLLEAETGSPEHGFLLREQAHHAYEEGDADRAIELGGELSEHGVRCGNRDLEVLGWHEQGLALIARGDVAEGMALLDEAMISALAGELSPFWTGVIYCNLISVCSDLADYRRAAEWTDVAGRWCEEQSITGFPGICRIRRGEILRLRGAWTEAKAELDNACVELERHYVAYAGAAYYEIGEIHLRTGQLDAATEALGRAHQVGTDPQPALALIDLARGDVTRATAVIRRLLTETDRPPLARARLLPAAVEVLLAAGDVPAAERAATELADISTTYRSTALDAMAAFAGGSVAMARGADGPAVRSLQQSLAGWQEIDAPYEAARSRLAIAEAYRRLGDTSSAEMEEELARSELRGLGADLEVAIPTFLPPHGGERTTRTFIFIDIVASTELVSAIGDDAWHELKRWYDHTVERLARDYGGEVVHRAGDGAFLAFPDASTAIGFATSFQRSLADQRRRHGFAPTVRIGIHSTTATQERGDYSGLGVHEAARIGALAEGGEILASRACLSSDVRFENERTVRLRGIPDPVEVASVLWH